LAQGQVNRDTDGIQNAQRASVDVVGEKKHLLPAEQRGRLAGTPDYMAPEQLMGQPPSTKTDQFSFCVALYEALFGETPFDAEPPHSNKRAARTNKDSKRTNVPDRVRQVVWQGLSADPGCRHRSMDALLDLLAQSANRPRRHLLVFGALLVLVAIGLLGRVSWEKWNGGARRIESVAVLPLDNLTGDPSQEYFVDGVTEAIISDLAQITTLRVISRTSAMHYKENRKPLREIARDLGVDALVEGSVARWGDRVRVTAQLIDGSTDRHIWSNGYEREIRDILALQREVAQAIAGEIAAKIQSEEQEHLAQNRAIDPHVYEAYLKGRFIANKRNEKAIRTAIEYFEQALQWDPEFAPAYAGLADCYHFLAVPARVLPPRDAARLSKSAAAKALSLDDRLAEAHTTLGWVLFSYDSDLAGSEREFKRALELNPSYVHAHIWYSYYLLAVDRVDEAHAALERARQLDPLSPDAYRTLGRFFFETKDYDRAIDQYKKALELAPEQHPNHYGLGLVYEAKKNYAEALDEYKKALLISPGNVAIRAAAARIHALSGRQSEAEQALQDLESALTAANAAYEIGRAWALLGRDDRALEWLERRQQQGAKMRELMAGLKNDSAFDRLRSTPRFQALLEHSSATP
jgi:TolB-like protein/Tfp pilus assembly protein PilF